MILSTAFACLAMNIYHENRGDTYQGQSAVAQVTMNRAQWRQNNVCKTVMERNQFSWTRNAVVKTSVGYQVKLFAEPKELKAWETAKDIAFQTLNKHGSWLKATHYHALNVHPEWANKLKYVGRFGNHVYYTVDGTKHEKELKYAFGDSYGKERTIFVEYDTETLRADGGLPPTLLERILNNISGWYEQPFGWFVEGNATV